MVYMDDTIIITRASEPLPVVHEYSWCAGCRRHKVYGLELGCGVQGRAYRAASRTALLLILDSKGEGLGAHGLLTRIFWDHSLSNPRLRAFNIASKPVDTYPR